MAALRGYISVSGWGPIQFYINDLTSLLLSLFNRYFFLVK